MTIIVLNGTPKCLTLKVLVGLTFMVGYCRCCSGHQHGSDPGSVGYSITVLHPSLEKLVNPKDAGCFGDRRSMDVCISYGFNKESEQRFQSVEKLEIVSRFVQRVKHELVPLCP